MKHTLRERGEDITDQLDYGVVKQQQPWVEVYRAILHRAAANGLIGAKPADVADEAAIEAYHRDMSDLDAEALATMQQKLGMKIAQAERIVGGFYDPETLPAAMHAALDTVYPVKATPRQR